MTTNQPPQDPRSQPRPGQAQGQGQTDSTQNVPEHGQPKPGEPGYDPKRDMNSPEYDPNSKGSGDGA